MKRISEMSELRKQQEVSFRKKLILDAAKIIFFEKGFENSTMEDIAHEAGYSKGSLYSYFNSKNEICFCIVNDYFSQIFDFIKKISMSNSTGLQKIIEIKEKFILDYSENSILGNIYDTFKYHRGHCAEAGNEIEVNESHNRQIRELLASIVQSGIDDGSISRGVDAARLSQAFWNDSNCFIAETMFRDVNAYDYLFDLIIDSISEDL